MCVGATLYLTRLHCVKKTTIATHAECIALPPGVGWDEVATAAAERFAAWGGVEYAAFGLDYGATVLRSFSFPFGGHRQIKAVLPHEFADSSLLPPDGYCLAHTAPRQDGDASFTVTAAAANRAESVALVRAFAERGVSLRALSPVWAVLPFAWHNVDGTGQSVCFVDTAPARDAYVLLREGIVRAVLCLPPSGGIDQLAGRTAFFLEQAESVERIVLVGSDGADDIRLRQLADRLGLPVETPGPPRSAAMSAIIGVQHDRLALAAAQAASLLTPRPGRAISFLTGELAPVTTTPKWQTTVRALCVAACCVAASLCILEGVLLLREQGTLRPLQRELFRSYREALADVPATTPLPQMRRIMETRLRERGTTARAEGGSKGNSALDILAAVHQALLPDMQGVADALSLSRDRFTLSGTVTDFKVADTIREKLAALPLFADVRLQNVQRGEKQRVRYEIEGKLRVAAPSSPTAPAQP